MRLVCVALDWVGLWGFESSAPRGLKREKGRVRVKYWLAGFWCWDFRFGTFFAVGSVGERRVFVMETPLRKGSFN